MNKLASLFAAAAASIGIAACLSLLPALQAQQNPSAPGEVKVFRSQQSFVLDDRNLADAMASLHLHTVLHHVEWSQGMLTVDLKVSPSNRAEEYVYRDLLTLANFGLHYAGNVNRMLVRVLQSDPAGPAGESRVLVAMDARKNAGTNPAESSAAPQPADTDAVKSYLEVHYYLTYTDLWNNAYVHRHG